MNFLHLSADVAQRIGKRLELASARRKIGSIHVRSNDFSSAIQSLHAALEIASEINARQEQAECHRALAEAHKAAGEYHHALDHFEKYVEHHRAAFDEESDRRLKTIEIIHEVENARKDAEIYQLRNVALQQEIEERKKAQAALERLATQDALTGLANRRHFLELAARTIEQARRYQRPLSIVMMDVDHFKQINDTFGHNTGDQVLVSVAQCMLTVLRKVDILGRYGGDEFVILLPETTQEGARRLTERLRQVVSQQSIIAGGVSLPISLSIGLTSNIQQPDLALDELLQRADRALYYSKQAGRDRVTAYEDR